MEDETTAYRMAEKPGKTKDSKVRPTPEEVSEYRSALIEGRPFSRRNIKKKLPSLAGFQRGVSGKKPKGPEFTQGPDGVMRMVGKPPLGT